MMLSKIVLCSFLALFTFSVFAEDSDFGDDPPPTTSPATDVTTPPSEAGDYNKELTDAVGHEEPKVPQPDSAKKKPSVTKPSHDGAKKDAAAKKSTKAKKEKKTAKKDKSAKKSKKDKRSTAKKSDKKSKKKTPDQ